jgi:hypothetical protein
MGAGRWHLDQLGRLARQEVDAVFHNTLVASDYGILDEESFEPKPNYWGALLWRRLMGTTVLDTGFANRAGMHVYAHCLRGVPGGVAMLVLNTDPQKEALRFSLFRSHRMTHVSKRAQRRSIVPIVELSVSH